MRNSIVKLRNFTIEKFPLVREIFPLLNFAQSYRGPKLPQHVITSRCDLQTECDHRPWACPYPPRRPLPQGLCSAHSAMGLPNLKTHTVDKRELLPLTSVTLVYRNGGTTITQVTGEPFDCHSPGRLPHRWEVRITR